MKITALPDIDLEELGRLKEKNRQARLDFIDKYVAWLKKQSNSKWSAEQKKLIG